MHKLTSLGFVVLAACGTVKDNSTVDAPAHGIDAPFSPLTAPGVTITARAVAGFPVRCKVATPSTGGGTITYAATWTLDGAPFTGTTMTMFSGDTVPGTATHTGKVFACTVTATRGTETATATAQTAMVGPRLAYLVDQTQMAAPLLKRIDLDDPQIVTTVGPLGVMFAYGDLAWNPTTQALFAHDGQAAKALYSINTMTGAATLIGATGQQMRAIAFDPVSGKLLGSATTPGLYEVNTTTGAATAIGAATVVMDGLTADTKRGTLVGLNANISAATLYTIDRTTGVATTLAAAGGMNNCGVVYDPAIDKFWATEVSGAFYQYDPNAAYARTTIKTFTGNSFSSLTLALPASEP